MSIKICFCYYSRVLNTPDYIESRLTHLWSNHLRLIPGVNRSFVFTLHVLMCFLTVMETLLDHSGLPLIINAVRSRCQRVYVLKSYAASLTSWQRMVLSRPRLVIYEALFVKSPGSTPWKWSAGFSPRHWEWSSREELGYYYHLIYYSSLMLASNPHEPFRSA